MFIIFFFLLLNFNYKLVIDFPMKQTHTYKLIFNIVKSFHFFSKYHYSIFFLFILEHRDSLQSETGFHFLSLSQTLCSFFHSFFCLVQSLNILGLRGEIKIYSHFYIQITYLYTEKNLNYSKYSRNIFFPFIFQM